MKKGITLLESYIDRLGLRINTEKTRRLNMSIDRKVEFLGFQFLRTTHKKTKKRLNLVSPSPKSLMRCRESVRKLVNRSIPLNVKDQVKRLNRYLIGWTNYYRLGNSSHALGKISKYVDKRVRRLMQRHQGNHGYGWKSITSEDLHGRLGLFNRYTVLGLQT